MPTVARRPWSREETLGVFSLYCRTPFGRLHHRNPEIIALAARIGRTPSSVAMKGSNFASLDPTLAARGIRGLEGASRLDREIWNELRGNSERLADESEQAYEKLSGTTKDKYPKPPAAGSPTDSVAAVPVRRVQRFFRDTLLVAYGGACAVCDFNIEEMLVGSHIIPWADDVARRADPTNGLCLCAIHDSAFDGAFIAFDDSLRLILSPRLKTAQEIPFYSAAFDAYRGRTLRAPERFAPDLAALRTHRERLLVA